MKERGRKREKEKRERKMLFSSAIQTWVIGFERETEADDETVSLSLPERKNTRRERKSERREKTIGKRRKGSELNCR